jgi:TPR repeat protein
LLHLGSVGLIAAGIVAVFFGAGFSLLVRTADRWVSASAERADPEIVSLPPSLRNIDQRIFIGQASAPENKHASQSSAVLPAPTEAPGIDSKDDASYLSRVLALRAPTDTSAVSANAAVPAANSRAATALAPPASGLSDAHNTELLDHGDSLLRNGDVASARLFYERAADAGDGRAALRLGATFDPAFLSRLGLGTLQANPAEARSWYSRARDLGGVDAKRQLNSLEARQGK